MSKNLMSNTYVQHKSYFSDMKRIAFVLLLVMSGSCQKKAAHKVNPAFVGNWSHHTVAQEHMYFRIESDSRGWLDIYNAAGKQQAGDQSRKWLIKKSYLYFGRLGMGEEKFHIDVFPEAAAGEIVHGVDTIPAGRTYMVLDGDYFLRN